MTKAKRLRRTARRPGGLPRRGRILAFEALDVRAVLSAGSIVAGPWMPPMDQFDGRDLQGDFKPRDAGRPGSLDAIGDFASATRVEPGADRFGAPMAFDARGPGLARNFGPPPLDYHAPVIVSSPGALGGSTVLVLPPGGWNGMTTRDVVTTLLLIDLLNQSTTALPLASSPSLGNSAKAPPPSNLSGSLPPAFFGSPASAPDRLGGPIQNNSLSSVASTPNNDGEAPQASVLNAVASTSAQAFLLPGFSSQVDTSGSERFGDGGWVELTPRDTQLPQWRSPRVDEKQSVPARRLEEFADDAFWDDVLEGLEDLLDESEDEGPATEGRKPSRAVRNDVEHVEPIEPPTSHQAARYDEGGMIALDVAGNNSVVPAPAMVDVAPNFDAAPVTMEAGVALFQAFEWGEPSGGAQGAPAATSGQETESSEDPTTKPSDEPAEPVEQVAAGVGLGLLFSGPILRRRAEKRQIRLRQPR